MSETPTPPAQEDITQQATAPTPKTKPAKNPKRAAAGKATAQKTKLAREAQKKKKAAEEAAATIANAWDAPLHKAAEPSPEPSPEPATPSALGGTTTQWLALGSLIVPLIGLYYKREEIKNLLSPAPPQALPPQPPPQAMPQVAAPARGLTKMD